MEDKQFNPDWTVEDLRKYLQLAERIATEDLGLDLYPNQVEIITSDQMLERYSTIGLPLSYSHWKFGKDYVLERQRYLDGKMGLAYELVINSNPCVSYNMENNDLCTMILVLAHAACGHNAFFKMNYLFKDNTDADFILPYVEYANRYIDDCIQRYGEDEVETLLDACHALESFGVDKHANVYKRLDDEEERLRRLVLQQDKDYDPLMTTAPGWSVEDYRRTIVVSTEDSYDEENVLLFIEKNAPFMPQWKREVVRIVRKIAQYFYPQSQTKIANEGCASAVHYYIFNKLWEDGEIPEQVMLDFIELHTAVVYQPDYNDQRYRGINPYHLGFSIMMDVKRISQEPTEEDRRWFPDIAGCDDWRGVWRDIIENYRDDSMILQFLSPKLMREMRLFTMHDDERDEVYWVTQVADDEGYRTIRRNLSQQYARENYVPDIRVRHVDWKRDRSMTLVHHTYNDMKLDEDEMYETLDYVAHLWGYGVNIVSHDQQFSARLRTYGKGELKTMKMSVTARVVMPTPSGIVISRLVINRNHFRFEVDTLVAVAVNNVMVGTKEHVYDSKSGTLTIEPKFDMYGSDVIHVVYLYRT